MDKTFVSIPNDSFMQKSDQCELGGTKFDTDKPEWLLIPWDQVEKIVRVLMFGAKKYGYLNWTQVPNWKYRYTNALFRHLIAWAYKGEEMDKETNISHLAHAGCCLLFLMYLSDHGQEKDGERKSNEDK